MLHRPDAIVFDMGGVLLDPAERYDASSFTKSFPNGLPEPAPLDWFIGMSRECSEYFISLEPPRPAVDWRPFIARWLEKRAVEATDEAVARWRRIMEQWELRPLFPHVRPTLAALHAQGVRMGVVSNTLSAAEGAREHFRDGGILEFFETTVFSAEFGTNKPDPAIFCHALDTMGVAPERAWYVGDKPQRDICGAHRAGMTALLVDSAHTHRIHDAPDHYPDHRIPDITVLPELVASLSEE